MEAIRQIALRNGSSSLAGPSARRLNDAESEALTVLLDQMAANYPHQALPDETGDIWREGIERMALKYTLARVRDVLADFLIRPGQKFFPHPSEIAEALEERVANERAEFLKAHPYTPCAECDGQGMVVKRREDGGFVAVECECKKAWRRSCNAPSAATVERGRVQGQ